MTSIAQAPGGLQFSDNPPSVTVPYILDGESDADIVRYLAWTSTSPSYEYAGQTLWRQDVKITEVGYKTWKVDVPYGPQKRQAGSYSFTFSTVGGTQHITNSKETIASYGTSPPDHKGAINYDGKEVRGVDIGVGKLSLTYTFRHPAGVVTEAFAALLSRKTYQTNETTWHGFDPGEALFIGSHGSGGTNAEAEVVYQIDCSPNATDLTVGDITGIDKKGWEYLWIRYDDDTSANAGVKVPKWVYIERVYDEFNFSSVFGF